MPLMSCLSLTAFYFQSPPNQCAECGKQSTELLSVPELVHFCESLFTRPHPHIPLGFACAFICLFVCVWLQFLSFMRFCCVASIKVALCLLFTFVPAVALLAPPSHTLSVSFLASLCVPLSVS